MATTPSTELKTKEELQLIENKKTWVPAAPPEDVLQPGGLPQELGERGLAAAPLLRSILILQLKRECFMLLPPGVLLTKRQFQRTAQFIGRTLSICQGWSWLCVGAKVQTETLHMPGKYPKCVRASMAANHLRRQFKEEAQNGVHSGVVKGHC